MHKGRKNMDIQISLPDQINNEGVSAIYKTNNCLSAEKPAQLLSALRGSNLFSISAYISPAA